MGRGARFLNTSALLYGKEGEEAITSSRRHRGSSEAQDSALPGSETPQQPTSQDWSTS